MPPTVTLTPPKLFGGVVGLVEKAVVRARLEPKTLMMEPGVRLVF